MISRQIDKLEEIETADSWLNAYVDESGTNELDSSKPNVSNLFICVAIVVDNKDLNKTENSISEITKDFCGGAEIRSSRIGSDHKKRIKFLDRIKDLSFGYYALVINKDRIFEDSGLQYKKTFYKYINFMLYQHLVNSGKNMRIFADEMGSRDFMNSFTDYFKTKNKPNLFPEYKFQHSFVNSQNSPLVQLADLIAGTLTYCFDKNKRDSEFSSQFREILRPKEIDIKCWPLEIIPIPNDISQDEHGHDSILKITCINRAVAFIEQNENSKHEDSRMQAATLSRLLFARSFEDKGKQAIFSDDLIEKLKKEGFNMSSKKTFSSTIIGKIREAGIIIAGTNDGYRLAISTEDIRDYLKHDRSIIEPMINRLIEARKSVKTDTANSFDILDVPEYTCLCKMVDAFKDYEIESGVKRETEND